jgi:signal transduction histidine kinase
MSELSKLEMLVMVSRLLSSKLDIKDLLSTIMRLATRVVNSERTSLYLLDEEKEELYFDVALELDEEVKRIRLKLGEGIAGKVAKEGKSIITNNALNDPSHTKKIDEKSGYVTRSLLTCPMIIKGKVIGVIQAINKIDGEFDEDDKDNFEAFASQAAIAIENSRLFNKVKDEKHKLENIVKLISEGVMVSDKNENIKMLNDAAKKYFGYNENFHKKVIDIFKNFRMDEPIENIVVSSGNYNFILERDEPKKLILECSLIKDSFKDTDGEYLWIFNDITQKVIEERISREFLSLISHKFRTLVTSIIGYSQLLRNINGLCEKEKKMLDVIVSSGFKINSLIDEMLDFSVIENKTKSDLKFSNVQVEELIKKILDGFRDNFKEVVFNSVIIDRFDLNVDVEIFSKAISEIIRNGIKFNSKPQKKIIVTSKIINNKKTISIWDNGNSISLDEIDKIFQKFYQIEQGFTGQTEGLGLGLCMVKKILELHGFTYEIKSKLNEHTLFTIYCH